MSYKVIDTQRISGMSPMGNTVVSYRVWIVTDRGASGAVDVPADQWNTKDLAPLLKAESDKLDLAFKLVG